MEMLITLVVLAVIIPAWLCFSRKRRYHSEFIAPIERELSIAKEKRDAKYQEYKRASDDADLFSRNLKREMQVAKVEKERVYSELSALSEAKSELHEEMDSTRESLDSWHRHSRSFFGNKGRKIKDSSLLGAFGLEQTMAQKRDLEDDRGRISAEISEIKEESSAIYRGRLNPLKRRMKMIYEDQQRLGRYRKMGLNWEHFWEKEKALKKELEPLDDEVGRLKAEIAKLETNFRCFKF